MEVNWRQHQLDRYAEEAALLEQQIQSPGHTRFIDLALNLIRTYTNIPKESFFDHTAAIAITKLARVLYLPIQQRGDWYEILHLWPVLRKTAEHLSEREVEMMLTKQLAIVKNNLGQHTEAEALYAALLASPDFLCCSHEWQAEILHQASVCYLDQSKYAQAQRLLKHALTVTAHYKVSGGSDLTIDQSVQQRLIAPLWAERTFILNLIGNLALLRGEFQQARRYYEESLAIYQEYGEEDNLACIAYQSLGRLLLHQGDYAAALPILEKNQSICEHRGVREGIMASCAYLAAACIGLSQFSNAEALLKRAIAESKALNSPAGAALCHFYWGKLAQKKGKHKEALAEWQQTLNLLESAQSPLVELPTLVALCRGLLTTRQLGKLLPPFVRLLRHLAHRDIGPINSWRLFLQYIE